MRANGVERITHRQWDSMITTERGAIETGSDRKKIEGTDR